MTKEIELTRGYVALVDDEDYERINQYKWYPTKRTNGELKAIQTSKTIKMHRLIMNISDSKMLIDHKNMNVLDNRKCNLRFCTNSQNKCNGKSYRNSYSKYKGVYWVKKNKNWRVQIRKDNIYTSIGCFKDEVQAAKAYDKAAKELHGEFARLNFG